MVHRQEHKMSVRIPHNAKMFSGLVPEKGRQGSLCNSAKRTICI